MRKRNGFIMGVITLTMILGLCPTAINAEESVTEIKDAAVLSEDTSDVLDLGSEEAGAQAYVITASEEDEISLMTITASGTCGDSAYWSLEDGVLAITGSGAMTDYSSSNTAPWYDYRNEITSVVIDDGITSVGSSAFYNCKLLTSVQIGSGVVSINEAAFYQCTLLSEVILSEGLTTIGTAAFCQCSSLAEISLPSTVTTIGSYAFQNVDMDSFDIPSSTTSIDCYAFFGSSIGAYTVAEGNETYSASNGVVYSADQTILYFYPAGSSAKAFSVPSSVKEIADYAFGASENLQSINFGSVTTLGYAAFQGSGLVNLVIPDTITTVDDYTFAWCESLQSVIFGNSLSETTLGMFYQCSALSSIVYGSLTSIGHASFAYCTSLTEVTLPSTVTSIVNGAFAECSNLVSFTSLGLTGSIPYQTFLRCTKLTTVNLNEGVEEILRAAFYACSGLEEITLPESVTYVHSIAFPTTTEITCLDTEMRAFGKNGYRHLEDVTVSGEYDYDAAYEVLALVNAEREANGLTALVMDESLLSTAMTRAAETTLLFAHTRPDGSGFADANSLAVGENIAVGQTTADAVMESWMNSEGHKANILMSSYTTIGIGCFTHNGVTYWVQCFGNASDAQSYVTSGTENVSNVISIATETFQEDSSYAGVSFGTSESYTYTFLLNLSSASLQPGNITQAELLVQNAGASSFYALLDYDGVTWTSSDETTATVSASGTIRAVSTGAAEITASLQYYSASASLTVGIPLTSIALSSTSLTMEEEDTETLTVSYTPSGTTEDKTITWTSSDSSVATVNSDGTVTAVSEGTAQITATSSNGLTAVCEVTVTEKQETNVMYRLYNPNSGEHFYTASTAERTHLISVGWRDEGIGWYAPVRSSIPVYRLYNPNAGDHHYTTSVVERNHLMSVGWNYEGIGWYSDENEGVALYRQYNPNAKAGAHNYTTSITENNYLVSLGWRAEGIGWYGCK